MVRGALTLLLFLILPVLFPLTYYLLPFLIPSLKARKRFEWKNGKDPSSVSWANEGEAAQVAFEVSSEGELEQVRPFIERFLHERKKVELIFCSKSVEKNCLKLWEQYPQHLRLLRLPLITYFPWGVGQSLRRWLTAPTLVLCRYDFFPELLWYGSSKKRCFVLVSATLKGKNSENPIRRLVYGLFDIIVAASPLDLEKLKKLLPNKKKIFQADFRLLQIKKRLDQAFTKLTAFAFYPSLSQFIQVSFSWENRLCFGSFWPEEVAVFEDKSFREAIKQRKLFVALFPHELNQKSLEQITSGLHKIDSTLPLTFITENDQEKDLQEKISSFEQNPGIFIFTIRGILCEMYTSFGHSFVGGGHGRSIHSVLEPYLSSSHVYCGPKTHRSTEFDLISTHSPPHVHVVNELKGFYAEYNKAKKIPFDQEKRESLWQEVMPLFEKVKRLLVREGV